MIDLREEIRQAFSRREGAFAQALVRQYWDAEPGPLSAAFILAQAERLRHQSPLAPWQLAILRSSTVEPIVPLVRAGALAHGIDLSVHVGSFDAYTQDVLDANSALYAFDPDAVILAVDAR